MSNQNPPLEKLKSILYLFNQGKLKQALSESNQMVNSHPNSSTLFNIIGASYSGLREFDSAVKAYKKALEINPNYAEAYYNIGIALKEKGDQEAAIDNYKKAIKVKPNYSEAYYNMANILKVKGDYRAAIESYKKALKINPEYAEAYYNLGNIFDLNSDHNSAIDNFKKSLKINPNYAQAYNNLGISLKNIGDRDGAIMHFKKALKINPEYTDAYKNLANILKRMVFIKPIPGLIELINSIIEYKNIVRPIDISQAAISLLKFEPPVIELLQVNFLIETRQSLEKLIVNLSEINLLMRLMSVCPLPDLQLEAIFRDIRSLLLLSDAENTNSNGIIRFQSALALQCFTNEYIYIQNKEEELALLALEAKVEEIFSKGGQPKPQSILCLASYKNLYQYEWSDLLILTPSIEEVVTRHINEPKEESDLKSNMPVLKKIKNTVSSKVRDQYEENPYPRWINIELSFSSISISDMTKKLNLRLFNNSINNVQSPNILIAGCGTGQHPIKVALQFKKAKVLAIDLSLNSLAYAKRKTKELGIQNIDYMQADILEIGKLNQKFDLIESAGVLHHMEEPMAGWNSLKNCLKTGGLMKISLYSELARIHIVRMREEITKSGIKSNSVAMRTFRNNLINSGMDHHKKILSSKDFYNLSELRDLLFHVKEHRFTIPQLKDCLSNLNLKFCGFESDIIVRDYKQSNKEIDDLYNLDKWHLYEEANPDTFISMYQFWCQKVR